MSIGMTTRRVGAGLLMAAGAAQMAAAEMRYENGSGGSVQLYGQFNPAFQMFDDGVAKQRTLVDNAHSNSRVGIWVRQPMGTNTFSFNFETGLGLRSSSLVTQGVQAKELNWRRTSIRKVDFSLQTERAGTFSFGQGSMAADGAAEVDLSGTTLVTYVSVPDTAAGFRFRNSNGTLSSKTIGGSFSDFDAGRLLRVRYDTPDFNGFSLAASYGKQVLATNVDYTSAGVALRYAGEFGDIQMKGAIGYSQTDFDVGADVDSTVASFSMLHASGFNVTVAAGKRNTSGNYYYGKVGYQGDWVSYGKTAVTIDYYRGNDHSSDGAKSTSYSLGVVQSFDNANIDAYLGVTKYTLTETTASYLDASSVMFGMRWKY